jgi:prepilin-type N-terminal cleavage/methylation domain-containing protein
VVNSPPGNGSPIRQSDGFSLLEIILVVGLIGVISAIAVPMLGNAIANFRLSGDARSVSNAAAVAKMRAASDFSRVRLYVNLSARTHQIQRWTKAAPDCCWVTEGGITSLHSGVSFAFNPVTQPPPSTQATIGQAAECTDDEGTAIANTACFMFNSRGVPINSTGAPTGGNALYLTDGSAVYSVTIAATGMLRMWRALPVAVPTWVLS